MTKKAIPIITIFLTLFLMIGAASAGDIFDFFGSNEGTPTDAVDDEFVIGFNDQFPPFGYKDESGEYTGFDIELAKEVCRRNNWTFKAVPTIDWDSKKLELDSGEIDCIWSEFTINGREDEYTWSEPYFNNSQKIIVNPQQNNINSIEDLKGKVLEVEQGTSVLKTIKNNETLKNTFKKINEVDGYDTALVDLKMGVCDAVIIDSGLANYVVAEEYPDFKILNESLSHEQYGIGFKKGNTELRDQVQKTLDEMFKDGTVDKIAQKYSKYNIPEGIANPNN